MKTFEQWLSESVSISIKDFDDTNKVRDISSLSNELYTQISKVFPLRPQYNPRVIEMDGLDVDSTSGVINVYHVQDNMDKIVKAVIYYMGELGAKPGKPHEDMSNMYKIPVTRIPVTITPVKEPLQELNIANEMAIIIFQDILNYRSQNWNMATLDAKELLIKLSGVTEFQINKQVTQPKQDKIVFHGGVTKERIERILGELERIAKYAVQNGY